MSKTINISLRSGERIFVNGAVLRVDRKVSLELLNNVSFLLENHVLQPDEATTPLRQLYFITQSLLIDPINADDARKMFEQSHASLLSSFECTEIKTELKSIHGQVAKGRIFDALKAIRSLYPREAEVMCKDPETEAIKSKKKLEMASCPIR